MMLRAAFIALVFLLHEATPASYEVGNVDGVQLATEQGRATLDIPVPYPKYFPDLMEKLTISYDSFSEDGDAGYGWDVDGLSSISRCPQTIAQDTKVRGIKYDKEDKFCLDGQRLMIVEGKYGKNNAVYYTEVDSYRKVTSHGRIDSGPAYFTVRTKDNKILTYGKRMNSRLSCDNVKSVHTWYLDSVSDYTGNEIKIAYLATKRGRFVSTVSSKKGKLKIKFTYRSRGDVTQTYFNGCLLEVTDKLLKKVTAIYKGKQQNTLTLTHTESGDAKKSILTSFKFCSRGNKCLKPVTLDYSGLKDLHEVEDPSIWSYDFTTSSGWSSSTTIRRMADITGDGLVDIVGFKDDGVYVAKNLNGSFSKPRRWSSDYGSRGGWSTSKHIRTFADMNGDGLLDVVGFANDGVYVSFNTGKETFVRERKVVREFGCSGGWRIEKHPRFVIDVNGDGLPDVVGFANAGVYVALNSKASPGRFGRAKLELNQFGYNSHFAWRVEKHPRFVEDVTGDGLPDIVGFHDGGVYVAVNNGEGFEMKTQWIYGFGVHRQWSVDKHQRHLIDISGDGLKDIVGFSPTGVVVAINTGKKFLPAQKWVTAYGTQAGGWKDGSYPRLIEDINGDGLPDIVGFGCCGVVVSFNTGTMFTNPKQSSKHFDTNTWGDKNSPRLLKDVNGDGIPDVVGFSRSGVYVALNKNKLTKLVKVVDSFNNVDEISYLSIANTTVYTRDPKSTYPSPDINLAHMVVWKITSSDGVGGQNVTRYQYEGLKTNLRGRGSLGFRSIKETEEGEAELVKKTYHQDFPLTGFESSNSHIINGHTVSEYEKRYKAVTRHNHVYQVLRTEEVETLRDLNGKPTTTTTRRFSQVDDFGNFGKVDVELTGNGKTFKEVLTSQYATVDKADWYIEKLTSLKSTKSDDSGTSTTMTEYSYDQKTRLLKKTRKDPGNKLGLEIENTYDSNGNVVRMIQRPIQPKHQSNTAASGRTVYKSYDADSILLTSTSNSLQHKESYQFDANGNMIKITGANGLVTRREFDAMDRPTAELRADGTKVSWKYSWDTSNNPRYVYKVTKEETGKPTEVSIFDSFERLVKRITDGFKNSDKIVEDIVYDKYGNVVKQSVPYYASATKQVGWVTYKYDAFGRDVETKKPITKDLSSTTKTAYDGFVTTKTNGLGHSTVMTYDALGRVTKVTDAMGGNMLYAYDAMDNLVEVTDPHGNKVKMRYDVLGNKVENNDPDMGKWVYEYDAFGNVVKQVDAKGQVISMKYDSLGRKVETSYAQSKINWYYDGASHGIGKVHKVTQTGGFTRTYTYDAKGRETAVTESFDEGEKFTVKTAYNDKGRIARQDYPGNKQVHFCYSGNGFLTMVKKSTCDGGTSGVYWSGLEYDPHGHVSKEKYGNNMQTEYGYTLGAYTESILTKERASGKKIRDLTYEHDEGSNMIRRTNSVSGTTERFQYDPLDRITRATIRKTDPNQQLGFTEDWEYDAIGNILRYSGLGNHYFEYDKNKPHAVTKAGTKASARTFAYDANGNVIKKNNLKISWTPFNKPTIMVDPVKSKSVTFAYNPDQIRYSKVGPGDMTTIYIGKLYERVTKGSGSSSSRVHKYFIYALGKLVAIESKKDSKPPTIDYMHSDHQSSIDTVTNEQGVVMETMRYNAFGRRLPANLLSCRSCDLSPPQPGFDSTTRGYTGHEHIDDFNLVHANGRIYDPEVGRFLGADPLVQDPYNTQSFNRYSYTLNNPLKHNDPTGHIFKKGGRILKRVVKNVVKTVGNAVKKVANVVKNVVKKVVNKVVNVAKQVWKEIKPYIRPAIALVLRIGTKVVGGILAAVGGPIGIAAGIAVVAIGEYGASRVEGKSHKEALKSAAIAGVMFGLGLVAGGASGGLMASIKEKSPLLHDFIEYGKEFGGYYKDALNFVEVYKENGPPKTLIGIAFGGYYLNIISQQQSGKNANVMAGISLIYQNSMDQLSTPFAPMGGQSGGPIQGLLMDVTKEHLLGLLPKN